MSVPVAPGQDETSERLTQVEAVLAYQERLIEELNQVVIRQQDQIELLEAQLARVVAQLSSDAPLVRALEDEDPPPHY